ncbi:MAG: hypothetical protein KKI08_04005, partial [Armatimonadetes bacterium]|nr:hypothetical protein [Armatimonadota bacterium]
EPGAILDASDPVTLDWQPCPDIAPGVYRAPVPFTPFTVTADGKIITMLNENRVDPAKVEDPNWQWPTIFKQGIAPTGFEGPKALGMVRLREKDLLIRFQGDLDPRNMEFTLAPREPAVHIVGLDRCVVRGLTIQNGAEGVRIEASVGSVVEGCTIRQTDFGVYLGPGADRCTVRFNDISMDPYSGADPKQPGAWQNWLAHKTGGFHDRQGVAIRYTVGGHEIHDNFIHDQWDGIETIGGPGENVGVNVHHNRIFNLSDDGLEPNAAEENCQWHDNLIEKCICGFRIKAPQIGPLFAYRNIFFANSEDYRNFNSGGLPGKPAVVWVYHNTSTSGTAITNNKVEPPGTPNYHYLNNLFYCVAWNSGSGKAEPNWQGDYNVYLERDPKRDFAKERPRAAGFGLDLHSAWLEGVDPGFKDFANHDVSLTESSPARGKGYHLATLSSIQLPGIPTEEPVDAGALQFGEPMPTLPRRPEDVDVPPAGTWPGPEAKSPGPAGPDLLTNGGFDEDFTAWTGDTNGYEIRATRAPRSPKYLAVAAGDQAGTITQTVTGLTAGRKYAVEYRSRRNTIADMRIIVRNPDGGAYLNVGSGARSSYWRRLMIVFTAPGPSVKLEISPRAPGQCDFDGFTLRAQG